MTLKFNASRTKASIFTARLRLGMAVEPQSPGNWTLNDLLQLADSAIAQMVALRCQELVANSDRPSLEYVEFKGDEFIMDMQAALHVLALLRNHENYSDDFCDTVEVLIEPKSDEPSADFVRGPLPTCNDRQFRFLEGVKFPR